MATRKKAAAPVEELEDDDIELEEEEEEAPKPKSKAKAKPAEDDVWGIRNGLIPLLKEKTGKEYTPREIRTLLRKMAREDNARIEREIIAGNKARYVWSGPSDPEVKAILTAVKGGEVEQGKKEALDKLKEQKAAKQAAKGNTPTKRGKAKKATPPPDDDDDEFEELDDDD